MFDKLLALIYGEEGSKPDELQLAVAALLLEAAWRDDVFDANERAVVEGLLTQRFDLTPAMAQELVATVEARGRAGQLFGFTTKIVKNMDEAERIGLIEMLWEVAYADGVLDPEEDALIRRVAGLVYVSDQDRGAARKRVRERLGLTG